MWRPKKWGDRYFYSLTGRPARTLDALEAFALPEVNAALSLRARAFSNGLLKFVNEKGREVPHRYEDLIKNPNWFQPITEFQRQTWLFRDLFGNEFIYILRPSGMDNIRGLFTLPPNLVNAEYVDSSPFFLFTQNRIPNVQYSIELGNGKRMPLDHEALIHLNADRVSVSSATDKSLLQGQSKLESLSQVVSNLFDAYESRGIVLRNRGALGILSAEGGKDGLGFTIPASMQPEEKKALYDEFRQNYGLLKHHQRGAIIISNWGLKWQPIEVDPDKLGLYTETKESFKKVLDTFGIPEDLFARDKGATYENQNQARKSFYENTIVPEANEWVTALNQSIMEDEKVKLIVDYTHLPCFQEDLKVKTEAVTKVVNYLSRLLQDGAISHEEYREELFKHGIGNGKPLKDEQRDQEPEPARRNGQRKPETQSA
jgi:phage portal protein BeeE